jgi:hypothetical protein
MSSKLNPFQNPSPKEVLLQDSVQVNRHRRMVESDAFQTSLNTAQLHYVRSLCAIAPANIDSAGNIQAAAACFQRIQGMLDFSAVLIKLAEMPTAKTTTKTKDNLE